MTNEREKDSSLTYFDFMFKEVLLKGNLAMLLHLNGF